MYKTELTNREKEVKELILLCYTNRQIANELIISVTTAKRHVSNILMKFNVDKRMQIFICEIDNLKAQINSLL